jgi:hypothetical protein
LLSTATININYTRTTATRSSRGFLIFIRKLG